MTALRFLPRGDPAWSNSWCHHHGEVVPVESSGEVVAQLCLSCDGQLPPRWLFCKANLAYGPPGPEIHFDWEYLLPADPKPDWRTNEVQPL